MVIHPEDFTGLSTITKKRFFRRSGVRKMRTKMSGKRKEEMKVIHVDKK